MTIIYVLGIVVLVIAFLIYINFEYIMVIIGGGNPYTTGSTVPMPDESQLGKISEEEIEEMRKNEREKQIAAIRRRFDNHEEILGVIDKLSDFHQDLELEYLVGLTKKQRDELNWEEYKNTVLAREEEKFLKNKKNSD